MLAAAPAVPYSSPSVFSVGLPGNQLTQQLYPGLAANQPTAILGALQPPQLVAVPQPSPSQLRPGAQTGTGSAVMTSSVGESLQPMVYWYPPGSGQVSPAGNAYLMPTCGPPAAATCGLAQVPDMLTLVDGVYQVWYSSLFVPVVILNIILTWYLNLDVDGLNSWSFHAPISDKNLSSLFLNEFADCA